MLAETKDTVKFFVRQQINGGQLGIQQGIHGVRIGLKMPAKTRFGSHLNMVSSVVANKVPLASTVVQPGFDTKPERAQVIKERCVSDKWFKDVAWTESALQPLGAAIVFVQVWYHGGGGGGHE